LVRRREMEKHGSRSLGRSKGRPESREDVERNPFTLPSDEEMFRLRDQERRQKEATKKEQANRKVWEKMTGSAVTGRASRIADLIDEGAAGRSHDSRRSHKTKALVTAGKSVVGTERRPEKENMAEFIAKKREMFLVQMSLDTKREEIWKLEEKAQMKEEALKKSEQMLEEDAIRFDTFLKENDKKAHEAIKAAERETKLKQDKVQEIKKLNQAIQMVQSEMSKHKEALEDCLKYKDFLDSLTPPEFFEEQRHLKRQRQQQRREERIQRRLDDWQMEKERTRKEWDARIEADFEALVKQGKSKKAARQAVSQAKPPRMPPKPDVDAEPLTSSGQDIDMFFTEPRQLLEIFTQLEEQNLFLIQNSQETEQALEELKQEFHSTQREMNRKSSSLRENIDALQSQIRDEESKSEELSKRIQISSGTTEEHQDQLLSSLHGKVFEVYQKCGFDVSGGSPNTLFMLSELEAKLEDLLSAIEQMPEDYVAKAEKAKEKQRRERKRIEQQLEQERQQEERNRRSNERSMMAPKKRTGRQVMFRSAPISRRTINEEKEQELNGDQDDLKFLT